MPYSSKMVEATQPVYPRSSEGLGLVPEDVKPEACRRLGCLMGLRRPGANDTPAIGAFFVHRDPDGSVADYVIPMAWLDDIDKDIWGEIKPWLASLHDEVA